MEYNWDGSFGPFKLIEHHIYGSSRLGIIQRDQEMDSAKAPAINESLLGATYVYKANRGNKLYEVTNHLGNVLTAISDRKIGHGTGEEYDYYTPDIVCATDYYPFGSEMPNRTYSTPSYRYGFNGKEKDDDVKGEGNQIDYGMRIYDPRLGRFLSLDPLMKKYPGLAPYNGLANNPNIFKDPDGDDIVYFNNKGHEIMRIPSNTQFVTYVQADMKAEAAHGFPTTQELHDKPVDAFLKLAKTLFIERFEEAPMPNHSKSSSR
jgi:RHS repeat-associated protein